MTDTYKPADTYEPEETYDEVAEDYSEVPGYADLQALLDKIFSGDVAVEDIDAEYIENELGGDYEYDYETAQAALNDYFEQYGVPEEHRQPLYDAIESHEGGYSPEALAQGLTVNYTVVNNDIDQSVHAGDYAEIYTENEANTATASAEGAVAVGDDLDGDVQSQTGDGVQAGEADNIQTGNYNVAGSDGATRIGNEQVSADYGSIEDSEFGKGDNYADDNYNSQNQLDTDVKDSFTNEESYSSEDYYSDDDHVKVDVEVGDGYEVPAYEEPEHYEPEHEHTPEVEYKPQPDEYEAEDYEAEELYES